MRKISFQLYENSMVHIEKLEKKNRVQIINHLKKNYFT